jgi:steroid 5-alpha reductase family enzyme
MRTGIAGWGLAAAGMALVWVLHRRLRNAGIVDVAWAAEVAMVAGLFAAIGDGWPARRAAIAAVMMIWGGRLSLYLLRDRVIGRPEDGRYLALRQRWGARATSRFFWFFQAQAIAAVFFALPALLAAANPAPAFSAIEAIALGLWVLALAGETTADRQLERFKADPAHRGRTCQAGLWRYSRHPNYFFEWLMWVAYGLFALGAPFGAAALLCPAAMLYLLLRVTGIPPTERQALRSREDYRRYQQTTSAFVPWKRRREQREGNGG